MPRSATLDRPAPTAATLMTRADAWDLFGRCLRDGHLVPLATAPVDATPATDAERWALEMARTLDDLTAAAWAENTLKGYGWHVTQWGTWCESRDLAPLPLDPAHVAVHLMEFAFAVDPDTGAPARNEEGSLQAARTAATVGLRLAALNKLAAFTNTSAPGDSKQVRDLMRGIRRTVGVRPHRRKQAIDHDLLKSLLDAAAGRTGKHARNRLAVVLRSTTGLSASHLAALTWFDLDLDETTVTVHTPDGSEITISDLVAVRVISQARSVATSAGTLDGPVLPGVRGRALTRQALHLAVEAFLTEVTEARTGQFTWDTLPTAATALADLLTVAQRTGTLSSARTAAMLLLGWHTALRRSNIVALNWGDLSARPNGTIAILVRKSKTDQEGVGRTSRIAPSPNPIAVPCPVAALNAWRDVLTDALGRAPFPDEPIFPALNGPIALRLTRGGRLSRLDGEMLNRLIQRLAVDAGLCSTDGKQVFGAHSLRAGFITEALRGSKLSIPEVQEISGHARVDTLMIYRREIEAEHRNASELLMTHLSGEG